MVSVHAAQAPIDIDLVAAALGSLGIQRNEISAWRRIEDDPLSCRRFAVMLEHTHALEAWCGSPLLKADQRPGMLLHIDAHDDLNSPSLWPGVDKWEFFAPMGPDVMSLDDPTTVRSFATRGFIGIGGFIAPLIAASRLHSILHVSEPSHADGHYVASLSIGISPNTGFIQVEKHPPAKPGTPYRRLNLTAAIDAAMAFEGHVLLDIDLDAFCNRYDSYGGSTVSDAEALSAIREAERLLISSGIVRRAAVTTIALSPGFFPGCLWANALDFVDTLRKACFN